MKETKTESVVESARNDVDQDVFLMFNVVDENLSWYLEDNIKKCSDPAGVDINDPYFEESNLMHGERVIKTTAHTLSWLTTRMLFIVK